MPRVARNEGRMSENEHNESYKGYANSYTIRITTIITTTTKATIIDVVQHIAEVYDDIYAYI